MVVTVRVLLPGSKEYVQLVLTQTSKVNLAVYTLHDVGKTTAKKALLEREVNLLGIQISIH